MHRTRARGACAAACAIVALFPGALSAAQYSFDMTVQDVAISGFFEVDDAGPNYVGGGTTTQFDLLDYAFTFTRGAVSFTGSPANQTFLQTFDMTYANDLSTVVTYDFSLGFIEGAVDIGFGGNNIGSGFVQIVDFGSGYFDASTDSAPTLMATLISDPEVIPLPAALPLLVGAMGMLTIVARRRRG